MDFVPGGSTAARYVNKKYGALTRTVPMVSVPVLTTPTQLTKGNPRRMLLELFNFGSANIYVLNDTTVTVAKGILLSPLGGSIILDVDEDGELVTYDWYAIAAAVGNNAGVLEIETL